MLHVGTLSTNMGQGVRKLEAGLHGLSRLLKFCMQQIKLKYFPEYEIHSDLSHCMDVQADLHIFCSHVTSSGFLATKLISERHDTFRKKCFN